MKSRTEAPVGYAELDVLSNFTFLQGASHPAEFVLKAAALGLQAIGIADVNSLAGVVRAHVAAKEAGLRLVVGARLRFQDSADLLAFPMDRAAYGRLCRLLTLGRRRAEKGDCVLYRDDLADWHEGLLFVSIPPENLEAQVHETNEVFPRYRAELQAWRELFPDCLDGGRLYLAARYRYQGDDARRLRRLSDLAVDLSVPMLATNGVIMHGPARRPLADVLSCIREKCTIDTAGYRVLDNAERHLKSASEMGRLFQDYPEALACSLEIVERCSFNLDELRYDYPDEITSEGRSPQEELEYLTWKGARRRYPGRVPEKIRKQLEHELNLIGQLSYAPYFLTVYDLVRFAESVGILCQGRGSAANSAVCFCLGVTEVDPDRTDLLFERFISSERNEPPDIDVDFEHERREEVIQYIYEKYGRAHAGLTATVIHYRTRGAIRDVGKAMGLSADSIAALATQASGWSRDGLVDERVREIGLNPGDSRLRLALDLAAEITGFPRHLSQHVGGFVMTRGRLDELVPVENAAMEDRTVIQWDKDDLDALGILKVDVLSLGMLTCLRKGLQLIRRHYGASYELSSVPGKDTAVYDMLCRADAIGVFQVESRAQMNFLPRMKPRNFYDLVIEIAIVRPGPIQGDMVHPYLRRRNGEEKVHYPSEELRQVLQKTLGVPLFQEQAMSIAMVAAGFTASEADKLRRAMATFRNSGTIHTFREKMIQGMIQRGYEEDFAERCFRQIEGFGEYGFPESHAASFALLAYVSAWMKCRYPAAFACALLNSQPMGFYAPAQIIRDAREHGVEVRPADVNHSDWDSTLETGGTTDSAGLGMALRIGLRQIKGLSQDDGDWLVAARGNGYTDPLAIWRRAGLSPRALDVLARADAFSSMTLDRRQALWQIKGLGEAPLPLFAAAGEEDRGPEPSVALPTSSLGEEVVEDYASLRLSLKAHPMALLREQHPDFAALTASDRLLDVPVDARIVVSGLVLVRQRPGSASGVIFITLEDETGVCNVVVWPKTFERFRRAVVTTRLMRVTGRLQREGIVVHLVADKIEDLSFLLDQLGDGTDFQSELSPADEFKNPVLSSLNPRGLTHQGKTRPVPRPRHPRDQAKVLFPSRDFH
ncbi:error-prone DNA polymerase [Pelagibius sp. Alg239-R121]|uniref:error-prone DNA polymerase n=1 Tax=Pelagibius sp. Alg239-R121 TaxID=2993448 RepID=UPI0024A71FEE|nr:error-prone DNA polymerase [Pelagibius sp. Alg239-R121]